MNSAFQFDEASHTFRQHDTFIPSVTQIIANAGLCDYSFVEEEKRKYYLKRGRSVHWMLQLEDEGSLDYRRVPKALRGYRKAYCVWKTRSGFFPQLIEHKFVSALGFAGIMDRFGTLPINGMRTHTVLDFKTGEVPDWVKYQLAAYATAAGANIAIARTFRRIGLSLRPDGTYKVREFPLSEFDRDLSTFIVAMRQMNG